jgi:CPA2 family monovalent cation:H+ antiporter-2
MVLSSYTIKEAPKIYDGLSKRSGLKRLFKSGDDTLAGDELLENEELNEHIVVLGSTNASRYAIESLKRLDEQFVVVDYDPYEVERLSAGGVKSLFGDATNPEILKIARIAQAKFAVVTLSEGRDTAIAIKNVKKLSPDTLVMARIHDESERKTLLHLGVEEIIQPDYVGGKKIAWHVLKRAGFEDGTIQKEMHEVIKNKNINDIVD